MNELTDKAAIVTGASQGIGRGIALAFAEAGSAIVAAARSTEALDATVADIRRAGGTAVAVTCDVQRLADIERCVETAVATFGGIDILVNNAQNIRYLYLLDSADEVMTDAIESGPVAAFRFMRAAHVHLAARNGVIVNVGSSSTHLPDTSRYGPYNAAKRGIDGLTRAAAAEWAGDGIRAFLLNPSAESAMTLNWKEREPEKYAAATAAMPGGRLGDPLDDIGRPLVQLVVNAGRVTGKTVHLDAGGAGLTVETITHEPIDWLR